MEYNKAIADFGLDERIEGFYILQSVDSKLDKNGNPYLMITLTDASGSIDSKAWNYAGPIGKECNGKIAKIRGTVREYNGSLQMNIEKIRLPEEGDSYDLSALVPCAPIEADDSYIKLMTLVDSIEDNDYRGICKAIFDKYGEQFKVMPAAKSVHHAFISGLLMHTLNMAETADFFADLYYDVVDRSLLLAGTILHDIAKIHEFAVSELGLATDYTVKGELLGHLVMGASIVSEAARSLNVPEDKSVLLQHMILSHHGNPEYGAAVVPAFVESELLSLIDKVDSRMEIYREVHEEVPAGEFSKKIFALEKRIYHHK